MSKSNHLSVGQRIKTDVFGEGVVVNTNPLGKHIQGYATVLFDEVPPVPYNMGQNPAIVLSAWCEVVQ